MKQILTNKLGFFLSLDIPRLEGSEIILLIHNFASLAAQNSCSSLVGKTLVGQEN